MYSHSTSVPLGRAAEGQPDCAHMYVQLWVSVLENKCGIDFVRLLCSDTLYIMLKS